MTKISPQSLTSVTNFDFSSLHLLRHEINDAIKNAEMHLDEFTDDKEQAYLLLNSVKVMGQLARILELLSLDGASDLAHAIAKTLQFLYDKGDNSAKAIILDFAEAIITLDCYIEFALLKEMFAPSLLIPIINKLHQHLGVRVLDSSDFINRKICSVSIFNPKSHYQPLTELDLAFEIKDLVSAYRAGLNVLLKCKTATVNADDRKKLQAMQYACEYISAKSDSLFWQAVTMAVTDIEKALPLSEKDKRTLIFVEQVFLNYLSVDNKGFADLVGFACHRNNSLAQDIKQLYAKNSLNEEQLQTLKKSLFAPNQQLIEAVNQLIQEEINQIKADVYTLAKQEETDHKPMIKQIITKLQKLSSNFQLLNLTEASQVMKFQAQTVSQWQSVSPKNIDEFLVLLIVAENASIKLLKQHTAGAIDLPLHNKGISLHQLNRSYEIIIRESRKNLNKVKQILSNYIKTDANVVLFTPVANVLHEIIGGLSFLKLTEEMRIIRGLESYIKQVVKTNKFKKENLRYITDIVMAVDCQLSRLANNMTTSRQAMNVGHQSLNQLLVA